jgi:hypothetical protein
MVSPVRGDHRRFQAETPLIDLFKFAEPALIEKEGAPDLVDETKLSHQRESGLAA